MNYPTAEDVRAAVQAAHTGIMVVVTEASHGINGPSFNVAFQEVVEPVGVLADGPSFTAAEGVI